MNQDELCLMPALELRDRIASKEISPVEAVEAVLARIERLNPRVNAFCTVAAEQARAAAREAEARLMAGEPPGKLHGVPVSIKDLVFTRGIRTTGGSRRYEHFVPEQDDICVERLKAAGAIIIGKTNTPESGWAAITDNPLFGPSRNPWDPGRTTGGSSGGAGAAVALGMGPLAIGSDGGGSIRIPSSFCGVFGLKPSFGRVPTGPGFPGLWEGLSVEGPMTWTVADAALMMEVIAGRDDRDYYSLPEAAPAYLSELDGGLKGLRVAWSPDLGYAVVEPEVRRLTERAARVFAGLGCELVEATPDAGSPEASFGVVVAASLAAELGDELERWRDKMEPALVRFVERSLDIRATDYLRARMQNLAFRNRMQAFFERYDLLLTPVLAVPPFEVGSFGPREIAGRAVSPLGWMPFTYPFNITGQPAASVPCGLTESGLPVGLQLVGRRFEDGTVLRAAAAFERAAPWRERRPPLAREA